LHTAPPVPAVAQNAGQDTPLNTGCNGNTLLSDGNIFMKLVPVILAGGQGSRLWPLSTPDCPKQYLPLLDPHWSLLQQTLQRAQQLSPCQPLLVCHEEQRSEERRVGREGR